MVAAWIDTEFDSLDLGVVRRNQRAKVITDQLAQMSQSQPEAAEKHSCSESDLSVRGQQKQYARGNLEAHNQASNERTAEHDRVILASRCVAMATVRVPNGRISSQVNPVGQVRQGE